MRVLVTGDRDWTNGEAIIDALDEVLSEAQLTNSTVVVIHGAARGADTLAGVAAEILHLPVEVYPADWTQYGRAAGPIRNRQMLNTGIDLALAFHSNLAKSKGTKDMVFITNKAGVPVRLFADTRR